MFIKVDTLVEGKMVPKHINVLMCTVVHDILPDDPKNKSGHKSVLYNSNGYASYSYLTADQIISAVQGNVVTEKDIVNHNEGK